MAHFGDFVYSIGPVFLPLLYKQVPRRIHVLQNALDQICDWFARWNIKINARETEAIVFRKVYRPVEAPIKIQNHIIPYSSSVKYLGLTLDFKLTFNEHTTKSINKAYGALGILYLFFQDLQTVPAN